MVDLENWDYIKKIVHVVYYVLSFVGIAVMYLLPDQLWTGLVMLLAGAFLGGAFLLLDYFRKRKSASKKNAG